MSIGQVSSQNATLVPPYIDTPVVDTTDEVLHHTISIIYDRILVKICYCSKNVRTDVLRVASNMRSFYSIMDAQLKGHLWLIWKKPNLKASQGEIWANRVYAVIGGPTKCLVKRRMKQEKVKTKGIEGVDGNWEICILRAT